MVRSIVFTSSCLAASTLLLSLTLALATFGSATYKHAGYEASSVRERRRARGFLVIHIRVGRWHIKCAAGTHAPGREWAFRQREYAGRSHRPFTRAGTVRLAEVLETTFGEQSRQVRPNSLLARTLREHSCRLAHELDTWCFDRSVHLFVDRDVLQKVFERGQGPNP